MNGFIKSQAIYVFNHNKNISLSFSLSLVTTINMRAGFMKKFSFTITVMTLVMLMSNLATAGDADSCKACHNGSVAPSVDTIKGKYKTADELVAAAKKVTNPMMKAAQADEAKLKAAAEEIVK
jgi:hypothetical protein